MTPDPSTQADQIVQDEKARRPRWRSAALRAPRWFVGKELDLLDPTERNQLYLEVRSRHPAVEWFTFALALSGAANAVHGVHSDRARLLWIALATGFVLVAIGVGLLRRRAILGAARRHVRESPDWPLRFHSTHLEADARSS